jgi:hypothetical protein
MSYGEKSVAALSPRFIRVPAFLGLPRIQIGAQLVMVPGPGLKYERRGASVAGDFSFMQRENLRNCAPDPEFSALLSERAEPMPGRS